MNRRRLAVVWAIVFVACVAIFSVAALDNGGPRSDAERVAALSAELACPECAGQAVSQSNAPAAVNIRKVVAEDVDNGRTDDEIRAFLADRFGEKVLLRPARSGFPALVWIVPVVAAILAVFALAVTFRRWAEPTASASVEDRLLVEEFLSGVGTGDQ